MGGRACQTGGVDEVGGATAPPEHHPFLAMCVLTVCFMNQKRRRGQHESGHAVPSLQQAPPRPASSVSPRTSIGSALLRQPPLVRTPPRESRGPTTACPLAAISAGLSASPVAQGGGPKQWREHVAGKRDRGAVAARGASTVSAEQPLQHEWAGDAEARAQSLATSGHSWDEQADQILQTLGLDSCLESRSTKADGNCLLHAADGNLSEQWQPNVVTIGVANESDPTVSPSVSILIPLQRTPEDSRDPPTSTAPANMIVIFENMGWGGARVKQVASMRSGVPRPRRNTTRF